MTLTNKQDIELKYKDIKKELEKQYCLCPHDIISTKEYLDIQLEIMEKCIIKILDSHVNK